MLTERTERTGYTDITICNEDDPPWCAYRVTCMDIDIDAGTGQRMPPTVHISLLTTTKATIENTRRLAREYAYVADVADALQAEKRAAYAARHGET